MMNSAIRAAFLFTLAACGSRTFDGGEAPDGAAGIGPASMNCPSGASGAGQGAGGGGGTGGSGAASGTGGVGAGGLGTGGISTGGTGGSSAGAGGSGGTAGIGPCTTGSGGPCTPQQCVNRCSKFQIGGRTELISSGRMCACASSDRCANECAGSVCMGIDSTGGTPCEICFIRLALNPPLD